MSRQQAARPFATKIKDDSDIHWLRFACDDGRHQTETLDKAWMLVRPGRPDLQTVNFRGLTEAVFTSDGLAARLPKCRKCNHDVGVVLEARIRALLELANRFGARSVTLDVRSGRLWTGDAQVTRALSDAALNVL
jgi:hypothetical protein